MIQISEGKSTVQSDEWQGQERSGWHLFVSRSSGPSLRSDPATKSAFRFPLFHTTCRVGFLSPSSLKAAKRFPDHIPYPQNFSPCQLNSGRVSTSQSPYTFVWQESRSSCSWPSLEKKPNGLIAQLNFSQIPGLLTFS